MENDITKLLKRRTYLFLTIFLFVVSCLSFFLLYGMRQSDHFTISNARLVYEQSILQAANPMIVQEIHTEEGASIVRGTLLVTVQNVFSDEELEHLKKNVELAQKNIEQIRYGAVEAQNIHASTEAVETARVRMERMNELYEIGAVSAAKRNEAIAAYEQEKNALTAGRGQSAGVPNPVAIRAAEEQLKKAEDLLAKARDHTGTTGLFAVREGTVSQIFVKEGDRIESGDDILSLHTMDNCRIEAEIPSEFADRIYPGQFVQYELNGFPEQGTVEEIVGTDTENNEEKMVRISVQSNQTTWDGTEIVLHFSS